jgi:hypothetical protein
MVSIEEAVGLESDRKNIVTPCPLRRERHESLARYGRSMSVADERLYPDPGFAIEDMWVGVFSGKVLASGFGEVGDDRSFAFRIEGQSLLVEVYRPRLSGPVPQPEDVVAKTRRSVVDIDVTDERSLAAAVRDAVALAEPIAN